MVMTRTGRGGAPGSSIGQVLGRGDLGSSLLFVFPLFLVYGVGVLFAPAQNGVDFISRNLFSILGHDRHRYLLVHLGLAAVFVAVLAVLRRRRQYGPGAFVPMFLESAIYALTLGSFILFVMRSLLGIDPALAAGPSPPGTFASVILSIGAGVHEELVFRLGVLSGAAALLRLIGMRHTSAVVVAFVVSSALFSAAHHLGALGDPWSLEVFTYRFLAGMLFGAIYYYRSLAHAAWTHALYDLYVLVLG
jgi:hypothetical protein